jgi:mannosyl-oligosaccharide alpha-1,2-mannosidase
MGYMIGIMLVPTTIALVWLLMTFSFTIPKDNGINPNQHKLDHERADAVKEAFKFAWDGYYHNAFPHDELRPASNRSGTSRNDWGATAVDALGTAILMDMPDVVADILDFIPKINFNYTATSISLFETNIRYLGGMISAYDLLSDTFASMVKDKSVVKKLLVQSKTLADYLSIAFNSSTGIPQNRLSFNGPHSADYTGSISLADAGTLVLEWTRLSDLLNDRKYTDMAQKAESYLLAPQPPEAEPFPGLVGQDINITSGLFINTAGSWGGSADSFYEYLLKMYVYDPSTFKKYKDRWVLAADSTMKYLASHPSSRPDLTFLSKFNGKQIIPESGHCKCEQFLNRS